MLILIWSVYRLYAVQFSINEQVHKIQKKKKQSTCCLPPSPRCLHTIMLHAQSPHWAQVLFAHIWQPFESRHIKRRSYPWDSSLAPCDPSPLERIRRKDTAQWPMATVIPATGGTFLGDNLEKCLHPVLLEHLRKQLWIQLSSLCKICGCGKLTKTSKLRNSLFNSGK